MLGMNKAVRKSIQIDNEIARLRKEYNCFKNETVKNFADIPISMKTLKGLAESKYLHPTPIQLESIGPALQGKDVLGTAITGSGKTLAFLIPLIEHLHINKWSRGDGVCAIVISPTRELAYQTFETLKKIGKYHDFSAGLIIGGKNLKFERKRMDRCNILICTPGRLLQHMDQNPLFNVSTIEMLVLDEADRCLDMGFQDTLNAIIENIPPNRQTLLFSATQTSSIEDLSRLNLHDPVIVGFQENRSKTLVPKLLQQNYVIVALEDKISMLWSFIKNHLKQKIIVFFASCKQVKYVMEIFCKLRPGTSLLALYGSLHQDRRIAIYHEFIRKSNVVLFATDIASRGLDFPSVNWVVQMDCPEDVTQYIHRAGRTARNKTSGESLLVLTPSEEIEMVKLLKLQHINLQKINIDPKKVFSPQAKIEAILAQNSELKASAQRAFLSYIKSIFLMKNKKTFKVLDINFDDFAKSLGLAVTPRIRFLERYKKQKTSECASIKEETNSYKYSSKEKDDSDSGDDLLKVKRINHNFDLKVEDSNFNSMHNKKHMSKVAFAKKLAKCKEYVNRKCIFDDEGNMVDEKEDHSIESEYVTGNNIGGINIDMSKRILLEEDTFDKARFKELVKKRHKNLKDIKKKQRNSDDENEDKSDTSVDLSWLPNPDLIYRCKNYTHTNQNISYQETDVIEPVKKKRKMTSDMSIIDAEKIAMKLLATTVQ